MNNQIIKRKLTDIHKIDAGEYNLKSMVDHYSYLFDMTDEPFTVAGGCLRRFLNQEDWLQFDIDLFFITKQSWLSAKCQIKKKYKCIEQSGINAKFETEHGTIDLIYNNDGTNDLSNVIDRFDLTVCCIGFSRDMIVYHQDFFSHLANKELWYNNGDMYIQRFQKYILKGYIASDESLSIIFNNMQCKNSPRNCYGDVQNEFTSVTGTSDFAEALADCTRPTQRSRTIKLQTPAPTESFYHTPVDEVAMDAIIQQLKTPTKREF